MKNVAKNSIKVVTGIKAGGLSTANHSRSLSVRSAVKAGGLTNNHSRSLSVRSAVKAGGLSTANHNRSLSAVR
ncbi:MAG TPA: hypothetical protein VHK47_20285 [Polyangia bacterium]|nr:hypothetical protein [Polyangia bacterium]